MTVTLSLTVFLCILGIALLYIIWAFYLVYKLYKTDQKNERLQRDINLYKEFSYCKGECIKEPTDEPSKPLSIREQAMEEIRELGRQDAIAGRPNRLDKPEYDYLMSPENNHLIELEHVVKKAQENADTEKIEECGHCKGECVMDHQPINVNERF